MKDVKIELKLNDLVDEKGDILFFKISFKQFVAMFIKVINVMATDDNNLLRLYASNVYTSLALLLDALNGPVDTSKKVIKKVVKKARKKRVMGMKPSDEELITFKKNGATMADVSKVYGVVPSTVGNWYADLKKRGLS